MIYLVKRLDKLSCRNNDVFVRAYFKLHVTALPMITGLLAGDLRSYSTSTVLDEGNDWLQMVMQVTSYFFDIRYNHKDLQVQESQVEEKKAGKRVPKNEE